LTPSEQTKKRRITAPRLDRIIGHRRRIASGLLAAGLLASCGRGGDWRTPPAAEQAASSGQAGYVTPPRFTAAARLGDGQIEIVGRADANAEVRLGSPDGTAYEATTDSRGAFSLAMPPATTVRLFGLSEEVRGRRIQGEGDLAVIPAPGRLAALLRAGVGAQTPGKAAASPQITAVDFDAGGGTVASGLARPGAALKLSVDGGAAVEGRADNQGRFSFPLAAALKRGDHQLLVQSASGQAQVHFTLAPAAPIAGLPFRAERQAGDWRIDWLTPGGAAQTTLIMD
jgi:hypothetical protein